MQRLSVLEIYILFCLGRGMQSGYDLLRNASLSIGATHPALRRLLKGGYISQKTAETASARPRFEFKLTAKGTREAGSGWKTYLEQPPRDLDLESALRITDMAAHSAVPLQEIASFLKTAAASRIETYQRLTVEADVQAHRKKLEYPYLKLRFEAARLAAEAETLTQLAESLKPKPKKRTHQSPEYVQQQIPGLAQKGK